MEREGNVLPFGRENLPKIVADVLHLSSDHSLESGQFWAVIDMLPVAVMISRDRACTRIDGNAASRVLLRAPPGQNLSRSAPDPEKPHFEVYADGKLVPISELPMQKAAASGRTVYRSECELRFSDGANVFLAGHSVPLFDANNEVCGSIGAFVDITDAKRLEEKNRLLSRELSHRIKNIVSVIFGISHQTIRSLLPPEDYNSYLDRLSAIARAHELLYATDALATDVESIVKAALAPTVELQSGQIEIAGPQLHLNPDIAMTVVMVLHELATNAIKYGALSSSNGRVKVSWEAETRERIDVARIHWKERDGPPVTPPRKFGFGSKLIRTLDNGRSEAGLQIYYHRSGVHCAFAIPLKAEHSSLISADHADERV